MRKHTEALWSADPNDLINGDEIAVRSDETGGVIACVWPWGDDEDGAEERKANAHLIAAAPQMKRHLTMALAWWYDRHYDGPETTLPEWVVEAEETLGRILSPDGDAMLRHDEVHPAISKADL